VTSHRNRCRSLGRSLGALIPVVVAVALATSSAQGAQPATQLVSATPAGTSADDTATFGRPQWSANGRVVFTSASAKLVPGDTNNHRDVFVRDVATGTTTLVSVGLNGVPANNDSDDASISADGRYVAFGSLASNLVSGDTNGFSDVFVRDLQTSTTTRLSVPTGGGQANGHSAFGSPAMISAGGRFVAFSSTAQNLAPGKPDFTREVYVADRQTGAVRRASTPQGGGWANGSSDAPSVSDDGSLVVFQSVASNLVSGDRNGLRDVFLRDVASGTTTLLSHGATGDSANGASSTGLPGMTPDGREVVISSTASNLVAGDTNQAGDVFVYDRQSDSFVLASAGADDAPAKGTSSDPSLSANGQWVAFTSFAPNLVPGDGDGTTDVFVRDLRAGVTQRASIAEGGGDPNGLSQLPTISPDASMVAFASRASNLVPGDGAGWDLFLHSFESDDEPPTTSCAPPDGAWHPEDVTIVCTASDAGSGLADQADARFTLTTSVAPGSETADAATDTHRVCDTAGNCTTVGPIGPNRIDRRAPWITISTPADGADFPLGATVLPAYSCDDGGSGTASCDGPAGPLDTTTVGYHEVTITTADAVGNRASLAVGYWVRYGWAGFSGPPVVDANAGRAIPIEFALGGGYGPHVMTEGFPRSATIACGSQETPASGDPTQAVGGGLRYEPGSERYMYVWKTDPRWAGTCRAFVVKLDDGSTHVLNVRFK
jgi:Tol biopolymer transport system component